MLCPRCRGKRHDGSAVSRFERTLRAVAIPGWTAARRGGIRDSRRSARRARTRIAAPPLPRCSRYGRMRSRTTAWQGANGFSPSCAERYVPSVGAAYPATGPTTLPDTSSCFACIERSWPPLPNGATPIRCGRALQHYAPQGGSLGWIEVRLAAYLLSRRVPSPICLASCDRAAA